MKQQKPIPDHLAEFGINKYTKDQYKLHTDISRLLTSVKYKDIPADDCLIVFGRVYSAYVIAQISKEKGLTIGGKLNGNAITISRAR